MMRLTCVHPGPQVSAVLPETPEEAKAAAQALWADMGSWLQGAALITSPLSSFLSS